MPSTFPSWSSNQLDLTGSTNKPGDLSNSQNNNLFLQILQQSQHQHHEPSYSVVPESHNAINVQPSCLVLPSQSLNSLKAGSSSVPINSNSMVVSTQSSGGFFLVSNPMLAPSNSAISDGGGAFDYGILSSLPNNLPFGMGEVPLPSSALGSSVCTTNGAGWRLQNQSANGNIGNVDRLRDHLPSSCIQGTEVKSGLSVSQGQNDPKINLFDDADQVKQEFVVDFPDGAKVGNTILSNFASGDFMGVLSKDSKAGCFLKS
ncbi:hypothetical protein HPP92_023140 [Vanilla planifolia]|uniref:Uncharacterized protein n=1 Tax=Vanilla planifolia TaxID=51239 RepID=A0A835UFS4_VANPL|nr:hypothetical protein HPP92_023140 [Vanilla planifolia]